MKKPLMILGAVVLAGLIAAGSFWGGMAYQTNRGDRARAEFMNARGLANEGQLPGDPRLAPFVFKGDGGGVGTTGQVKSIEENVLTLSTAEDVTTVYLSESTQIEKTVVGTSADLQPGVRVVVTGQKDDDGNLIASRIQILNESSVPPPVGTEP